MGTWNDTDEPLAYLITFRTYGTWLAGDERGSIDKFHNKYGGPHAIHSEARSSIHQTRLKSEPFLLSANSRRAIEQAFREVCEYRNWVLIALNIRTNHVHLVIAATAPSGKMLNDLKSYATRKLREIGEWEHSHSPWVDKGSRRNLWNQSHIDRAAEYVVNGQGGPLPDFD